MENNKTKTFEEEIEIIISFCNSRIEEHKELLEKYEEIKSQALSLLNTNNNTKRKVVSLVNKLKTLKHRLYALLEKEETED